MFYEGKPDDVLRLGDVVRGYISANPNIKKPFLYSKSEGYDYKINVELPNYSVVLTPCCSIGEGMLSLTPLIRVVGKFLTNEYFKEDLTRINRKMTTEQSFTHEDWEELTEEERNRRSEEGINYALLRYFIYEENGLFPKYTLKKHEISYYMIDFQHIFTIICPMIKKPEKTCPKIAPEIINSKVLQLSVQARSELRDKISYYYTRPPKEDMIVED